MNPCEVHLSHRPSPHQTARHHVWPTGLGGPVAGPTVVVCPTGHANIHRYIVALTKAGGDLSKIDDRRWHPEERRLGLEGYTQWVAAGKPGRPETIERGGAAE